MNQLEHLQSEDLEDTEEHIGYLKSHQDLGQKLINYWAASSQDDTTKEKLERTIAYRDQVEQVLTELHNRDYIKEEI